MMKLVIDEVVTGIDSPEKLAAIRDLMFVVFLAGVVYLVNALLQPLSSYINQAHTLAVTDHLHDLIHTQSVNIDLSYYENPKYFDNLHRAQQEAHQRPAHLIGSLQGSIQNIVTLLAISGLLFTLHPVVMLLLLVVVVPSSVVRLRYSRKFYNWQRESTATERLSRYYSWMMTTYYYAKEIRIFNLGDLFLKQYSHLRRSLRQERLLLVGKSSMFEAGSQILGSLVMFGTYVFIAVRTVNGLISMGDLVMYYQALRRGLGAVRTAIGGVNGLYENNLFVSNLFEFLDLEPEVAENDDARPVPRPLKTGIEFRQVSFRYAGSEKFALRNVDLLLRPDEKIALVGENGSGKSTLIKLLCNLYAPTEGEVLLEGKPFNNFHAGNLRSEISALFQDYAHYQLSAHENISFGSIQNLPDSGRIQKAAAQAKVHELLSQLPKGYETILGKWFENGEELSAGEWQKIALARAFVSEAQIIVLDEPTSSLDALTEFEFIGSFLDLLEHRSAIIVSHRFSTVRNVDRIYVFDRGEVIESGSHSKLMKNGGKYAQMFRMQASHFR